MKFPAEEVKLSLINQMVAGEAKVFYDNRLITIAKNSTYLHRWKTTPDANTAYKLTNAYFKKKRKDSLLDTFCGFMFGTEDAGTYDYTHQVQYINAFKFHQQLGQKMTIEEYLRSMK